jgi:histidinol-phosphatase
VKPDVALAVLVEIAERADALALEYFRAQDLRVEVKEDRTPVTQADLRIEAEARRIAAARMPRTEGVGARDYVSMARTHGRWRQRER